MLTLILLVCFSKIFSQSINVSGTVRDNTQSLLPGVSVKIKGTGSGTVTNVDGHYTLKVPSAQSVLVFSFIGLEPKEITVGDKRTINVVLSDLVGTLNEVVVTGYQSQRKGDIISAIGEVNMKEFDKAPVPSFDQALAGRIAGVSVISPDGQPGSVANIVIRGASSLTQDNSPLYIIDGFPDENSNAGTLNPAEIESITVLKDASATAIYGSRGANGVIIITTKRGKKGTTVIAYDGYAGFQKETHRINVLSPYDFVKLQVEISPNQAEATYLTNHTLDYYKNVGGISWQDGVFRDAFYQSHNLAIRGGDTTTQYSVSGSALNQQGVFINSGFVRYQGRFTFDHQIGTKVRMGITGNYSNATQSGTIVNNSSSFAPNTAVLYSVWGQRPLNVSATDNLEDQLIDPTINPASDYRINPILDLSNTLNRTITTNSEYNGYFQYNITRNLNIRFGGGINQTLAQNEQFYNASTRNGNPANNPNGVNGAELFNKTINWSNDNILTYNNNFNGNHNLNIIAGFTQQRNEQNNYGFSAIQLPNPNEGLSGLDEGTVSASTAFDSYWTLLSYLGQIRYNYNGKYYFTTSLRVDQSSKFPINKTGYFPSVSAAWRFTQEQFFKQFTWLSDGKLRAGFGVTGNNRVSDFAGLNQLAFPINPAYSFNNSAPAQAAIPSAFGNPDLKWESTSQLNLGTDLEFLNSRLGVVVDVYQKKTSNLLLNAPLPTSTGYTTAFKNIGKVQNQGLEITLNSTNIASKSFTWNSNFNIAFNQSKVLQLTDNTGSLLTAVNSQGLSGVPAYIAKVGQPVAQMYGYVWDGNYQYSDFNKVATGINTSSYQLKDGVPYYGTKSTIQPGWIKYKDVNGDGIITTNDYTVIGRATPIFQGGFNNNFNYKGFDLSIFLQFSYGNNIINANRLVLEGVNSYGLNEFASEANRWTPTNNQNNLIPSLASPAANTSQVYSSRVIEDGSFLRIKTVSLGYNVPGKILQRVNVKNLRVYVSAQNLYVFTKYTGPDPEVSVRNSALTPGYDYTPYPVAKTIIFGLSTSF